ncbi:hypothetical protein Lesp02_74000 [Lentzea sp. NBRC 105346]|uniref:hypothetical protein n=1 Tax=Lentzea sp. NBRC 105346 TaxID=3032205 RepID=UPI0024A5FA91|nr:hypothetical protein [Lentzea sp. NBRC 105346]GLZ35213.1 hypothetical protein Lesp02_74000 [Lentzea sp. NBRC 105346]
MAHQVETPTNTRRIVVISAVLGFLLTTIWSAQFVDTTIGGNVAGAMLGHDPKQPITGIAAGVFFAFASGLAGTFTGCNVAVFGAMAPMLGGEGGRWRRLMATLDPLKWLAAGMVAVSAAYGVVVSLVGTRMPQFNADRAPLGELTARNIQSMVVFGIIGVSLTYLGLAQLGLVRDPFARLPRARLVFLGALIGGFLIGRPWPLFRQLFRAAAESGNPLYGAFAFVLQSVGNILVMALLLLLLNVAGGRLRGWLAARALPITAGALILTGVFTIFYWDVRMLQFRGVIPWYPLAPWT